MVTAYLEHFHTLSLGLNIAHLILDHHVLGYSSIQDYIADKNMDQDSAWGTDIEMLTLAHLLQTPILSYGAQLGEWQRYAPHDVERTLVNDFCGIIDCYCCDVMLCI